jgi:hypothetical protein
MKWRSEAETLVAMRRRNRRAAVAAAVVGRPARRH